MPLRHAKVPSPVMSFRNDENDIPEIKIKLPVVGASGQALRKFDRRHKSLAPSASGLDALKGGAQGKPRFTLGVRFITSC
jgi:hypothetical protein